MEIEIFSKNKIDPNRDYTPAKKLDIIFVGGTFGNFLRYFIDKFSKSTPDILQNPFTEIGTSHNPKITYSDFVKCHHQEYILSNQQLEKINIALILPQTRLDFMYLDTAQQFRTRDNKYLPDHLWSKPVKDITSDDLLEKITKIIELYSLSDNLEKIPKFIVRDWYKLEYLKKLNDTYNFKFIKKLQEHDFFSKQNTSIVPLQSFFSFKEFQNMIVELDNRFNLCLDFQRLEDMEKIFQEGLELDILRQQALEVKKIIENIEKGLDYDIVPLDVSHEAFIYGYCERLNKNIQLPLGNNFFTNTREIFEYLNYFPNWYKKLNPNL